MNLHFYLQQLTFFTLFFQSDPIQGLVNYLQSHGRSEKVVMKSKRTKVGIVQAYCYRILFIYSGQWNWIC